MNVLSLKTNVEYEFLVSALIQLKVTGGVGRGRDIMKMHWKQHEEYQAFAIRVTAGLTKTVP